MRDVSTKGFSRFVRACVVAVMAIASSSCAFLRTAKFDRRGDSYEVLTARIAELQEARSGGVGYLQWIDRSEFARELDDEWRIHVFHSISSFSRPDVSDDASWDLALGVLHARRASSLARASPVQSVTVGWIAFAECDRRKTDGSWIGVVVLGLLMASVTVPLDLIVVPVTFTSGFVHDLGVDAEVRGQVRADLERARCLGLEREDKWLGSDDEPRTPRAP